MGNFDQLASIVLDNSESKTWSSCTAEWIVVDYEEDDDADGMCVCGKEGLRYMYTIRNELNGNELFPIGSECIKRFNSDDLADDAKCWAQAYKLANLAAEYGKASRVSIVYDKDMFTRKLLAFMYRKGAFPANKWNEWDGGNDYRFMLDMFNARTITTRQRKKADYVMRDSVYPWLRKLYKQRYGRKK